MATGQPDYSHLFGILSNSRIQQTNNALYQTIFLLIREVTQSQGSFVVENNNVSQSLAQLLGVTYLTVNDETALLLNSRQLLAGAGITFDDSVDGKRTIKTGGGPFGANHYDSPLSDGDTSAADLIYANGECIIVQVPV